MQGAIHYLYFVLAGVVFGLANVIPGVSGGTMAVVFGVYERIIGLIANLRKNFKKELPFFITFGAGALVGIFAFAKLMKLVLEHYPAETNAFFIGIILGSLPLLFNYTFRYTSRRSGKSRYKFRLNNILPMVITFAIMIPMALAGDQTEAKEAAKAAAQEAGAAGGFNLLNELLYIVYGVIAVTTMIIPGISGSFVMLLIGFYETIIGAVSTLYLPVLLPFAIGCVIGIFAVSKLIKKLLATWPHQTYSAILGFVAGSVLCIFPGWSEMLRLWPILMVIAGIAVMYGCSKLPQPEDN